MGSKLRLWGDRPPHPGSILRLNLLSCPTIEKKGAAQSPRQLWCGSNKCSPNHAKSEKFSLSLGLAVALAETNIFVVLR